MHINLIDKIVCTAFLALSIFMGYATADTIALRFNIDNVIYIACGSIFIAVLCLGVFLGLYRVLILKDEE